MPDSATAEAMYRDSTAIVSLYDSLAEGVRVGPGPSSNKSVKPRTVPNRRVGNTSSSVSPIPAVPDEIAKIARMMVVMNRASVDWLAKLLVKDGYESHIDPRRMIGASLAIAKMRHRLYGQMWATLAEASGNPINMPLDLSPGQVINVLSVVSCCDECVMRGPPHPEMVGEGFGYKWPLRWAFARLLIEHSEDQRLYEMPRVLVDVMSEEKGAELVGLANRKAKVDESKMRSRALVHIESAIKRSLVSKYSPSDAIKAYRHIYGSSLYS